MSAFTKYDYTKGGYVALPGTEDFVEVFTISEGGYEWAQVSAFYSPSRDRYYWLDEGGCSCTGPGYNIDSLGDFMEGDRDALVAAVKDTVVPGQYAGDGKWDVEDRARALQAIRDFRPGANA